MGRRLSCLGCRVPASFALRTVAIAPGEQRPYDEAEWRDALVVVEAGEVELACRAGGARVFRAGDVLWFTGLPLRALRNPGPRPAVLAAVSRRPISSRAAARPVINRPEGDDPS